MLTSSTPAPKAPSAEAAAPASPVRLQFYKPMHDYLTGNSFSGNYDLQPHGVLVLDEHPGVKT